MKRPAKDAILEQLRADGVRHVFGNPGTVEQGLLDSLEGVAEIEYVLALQETVAVGIADGYARATGGPAVVQLHSGVGLGNGIGMLYQAKRGHSPLVVLAGEAGVRYDAMDGQMAADLVAMARPVTKYATRVLDPASAVRVVRRAVKVASTPPCGPVFVALPMDVMDEISTEDVVAAGPPRRSVLPTADDLDRAAEVLAGGSSPLIIAGDGVAHSGAQEALTRLAELLHAPVWAGDASEVLMDTAHPLFRGQLGHMFGSTSAAAVAGADTVLIVGGYVFPEVFPCLHNPFAEGTRIVQIDLDDWEIAKNHPVDVALAADPGPTLTALVERLETAGGGAPRCRPWDGHYEPPAATTPLAAFSAELARRVGDDLVVVDEALTGAPELLAQIPPRRPGSYFATRGGSLGIGIPGAIGVKIARPDATVVGFTGDGGSMYTIQALWSATRYRVGAKFVICNNHRYALLDQNIERYWRDGGVASHASPDSFDLSEPEIDFVSLAQGMGVPAVRASTPEEIADAVERMLAHDGPFLVDLVTAPPTRRNA